MKYFGLFIVSIIISVWACKDDTVTTDPVTQLELDKQIIRNYLKDHSLSADSTAEGVFYKINMQGKGDSFPKLEDTVKVKYVGYFTDGKVFDQSYTKSVEFPLNSVIKGWQLGIPKFLPGGKGTLFIPSGYGYGAAGSGSIAPNTVLLFDIELESFK